jgi:tRNA(Ile)-lysidine synthase
MAMLTILHELSGELGLELAAAHFDHRIRKGSERDAALVASYCSRLGIGLLAGSGDVPARSKASAQGIEESARHMRYAFLESAARQWGAVSVALGHNRDDQVETILHHMIRGSGWRGLAGMPVRRGLFIRPILACGRDELKAYLRAMRVRYAVDPSNRDNAFLRNRIRNRLVPMLRKGFNPSIDDSIIRIGENILEGWQALSGAAEIYGAAGVNGAGPGGDVAGAGEDRGYGADGARGPGTAAADGLGVSIPLERIGTLTDFHLYLLIDGVLRDHFGIFQDVGRKHYDAARKIIRGGRTGSRVEFPHGVTMRREAHAVRFVSGADPGPEPPAPRAILPGEGTFSLPSRGLSVEIIRIDPSGIDLKASATEGFFHGVTFPVTVRNREPGDRVVPFGMKGRRKLADIFTDLKIPARRRGLAAVFEDGRGIFWVPGIVTSEGSRVGPRARSALRFRLLPEKK